MTDQVVKFIPPASSPRLRVMERIPAREGVYKRGAVLFQPSQAQLGEYLAFETRNSPFASLASGSLEHDLPAGQGREVSQAGEVPGDVPRQAVYTRDQLELLARQGYDVVVVQADVVVDKTGYVVGPLDEPDGNRLKERIAQAFEHGREIVARRRGGR